MNGIYADLQQGSPCQNYVNGYQGNLYLDSLKGKAVRSLDERMKATHAMESPQDSATYSEVDEAFKKLDHVLGSGESVQTVCNDARDMKHTEERHDNTIMQEDLYDRRGHELQALRKAYSNLTGKSTDATSVVWLTRKVNQLNEMKELHKDSLLVSASHFYMILPASASTLLNWDTADEGRRKSLPSQAKPRKVCDH